jgi:hypothetical protein
MAAVEARAQARLDIGKVFEQTFAVYGENFLPLMLASLIFVALPQLLAGALQMKLLAGAGANLTGGVLPHSAIPSHYSLPSSLLGIVSAVLSLFFQAGVNRFTGRALDGDKPNIADEIRSAGGVILPMIGVVILMTFGILLASLLLLVPGVMLALAWSVALPATAIENLSVMDGLKRSQDLTRGRRWSLLLLGLIVYVVFVILALLMFAVSGGLTRAIFSPVRALILQPAFACLLSPLGAIGLAALYHQLRDSREGAGKARTAAMFD